MERFERRALFEVALVMAAVSGVVAAVLVLLTGLSVLAIALVSGGFWVVAVVIVVVFAGS